MRIGTLFSGIGSPEQGAKRVYGDKLELVFACEWDKYARESFKANYEIEDKYFHIDINDMDGTQYKDKVDVIVGGSPCQDFSIAGLRAGIDGKRGQLIWQYYRIIAEIMPPVFIYENVKGMVSDKGGRTLQDFLTVFRELGYFCHYEVLNTKDYGIPQNRERIFIVGFLDHEQYYRFQFAPKTKLTKRLKDILEPNVDEKYYLNKKLISALENHKERHQKKGNGFVFEPKTANSISNCLTTKYGTRSTDTYLKEPQCKVVGMLDIAGHDYIRRVHSVDGIAPTIPTGAGGNHEPKILDLTNDFGDSINLSMLKSETRRGRIGKQVDQTLDCVCNQAVVEPMIYDDYNGNLKIDGIACTLTTNCGSSAERNGQKVVEPKILDLTNDFGENKTREYTEYCPALRSERFGLTTMQNYRIRKLTPRECFRLQDFPDSFLDNLNINILYYLQFVYNKINKNNKETEWNAKLKIVKEKQKQKNMETFVLCTTRERIKLAQLMRIQKGQIQEQIEKLPNVNIVIEKLVGQEQKECATNIIRWIDCTTTLYTVIRKKNNHQAEVIFATTTENTCTEQLWKITLEENLIQARLYIILIVLRQIIELKIYTYVKTVANIRGYISNLIDLQKDCSTISLSYLRMENTEQKVSNSMLYKQAGNSISVNVMEMIFNQIEKSRTINLNGGLF